MNVLDELAIACQSLNKIDEYDESLVKELSNSDLAVSDLYHYLETNKIDTKGSYRFCKELKRVLQNRRRVKQDMSMLKLYKDNINKLIQKDNRQLLLTEVNRRNKQLQSSVYKNSVYKDDELKELLEG